MSDRVFLTVAAAFFGLTLAGCSANASSGGDIASVNGQKIPRSEFDSKLESSPQAKMVLQQLVQTALIEQYGKDNHIDIADADINKKEDDIKSKYPPGQFQQILKTQNLSEDDVRNILRQQLIVDKAIGTSVHVSDADMKSYLDKNHATLDTGEQARARHILVADLKTAQMVEAKLKGGAKFDDLAKQYSTDPGSKVKGGELGFFSKGQMVPAFQAVAFSAPIGSISPPVKSPFGYHIIQVEERKPAQIANLANSRDKIRTLLEGQQKQQQYPTFLAGLRSKANVQIYDDRLKDALPPVPGAAPSGAASPAASASAAASPAATPSAAASR